MAEKKSDQKAAAPVGQRELRFFGPGTKGEDDKPIPPPTKNDLNILLDRENPDSPFAGYIGNDEAVEDLNDILFAALLNPNHNAGPNGVALIGPASTGKTTLARNLAVKGLKLPFVECDRSVKNTSDLLDRVKDVYKQAGVPLVSSSNGDIAKYKAPPGVIYFDEAQAIKGDWLLKATERNDATLITDDAVLDCRNILWIISTTHRGKLPKAFDTRFQKVFLLPYTLKQVGKMVKGANPDLPQDVCDLIASYGGRVPREALDFAGMLKKAAMRLDTKNWREVCKVIGGRRGVDEEGLTRQHISVLVSLFNSRDRNKVRVPMALKRLADQVSIEENDLEEYVLPTLQVQTDDRQPLIRTSSRGLELTEDGVKALVKRGMVQQKAKPAGGASTADFPDGVGVLAARSNLAGS